MKNWYYYIIVTLITATVFITFTREKKSFLIKERNTQINQQRTDKNSYHNLMQQKIITRKNKLKNILVNNQAHKNIISQKS
ncbi:MAG: hypothetical protein GY756_28290 [bacterium]|nr:hypothetical protein [bacterium]